MRCIAVLLLGAFAGFLPAAEEKPAKLPAEIQQAVDLALAAPPEFAASALLRLVDSGSVPGTPAKKHLVETAFTLAGRAQHPYPVTLVDGIPADTRSGYQARASRLKLDALSLQSRSLELMLNLDRETARELFLRMARPKLERLTCEASLIPDLADYYATLARLAQSVYNGRENEKNSRVAFLQTAIDGISSHAELAPAANLIGSLDWTAPQFEIVSGALLAKLQSLSPDDRSFSQAAAPLESAIASLLTRAVQLNVPPERIAEGYRTYLVAQLAAPRCADNGLSSIRLAGQSNQLFGESVRSGLAPLTQDEVRPRKLDGEAALEPYWQSGESKQIFEQCLRLRTTPEGNTIPESARATREWRRQLTDFLDVLTTWKPSAEKSEADYYHQRAIVYEALLELTPGGEVRNRVLEEYVGFLQGSNVQSQDPVEWFWHARSTLNRIRPAQPESAARLLAGFAASGNVVLSLEALLDRLAPGYSMFPA